MKTCRERLKAWRLKNGVSQIELARDCGVHQVHISKIELGARNPGLKLAHKLGQITGIPMLAWTKERIAETEE